MSPTIRKQVLKRQSRCDQPFLPRERKRERDTLAYEEESSRLTLLNFFGPKCQEDLHFVYQLWNIRAQNYQSAKNLKKETCFEFKRQIRKYVTKILFR